MMSFKEYMAFSRGDEPETSVREGGSKLHRTQEVELSNKGSVDQHRPRISLTGRKPDLPG